MKSVMTGRVPIPADHTAIPYGTNISPPDALFFTVIKSSETFITLNPVFTSMPSLKNFVSANAAILWSNLYERNRYILSSKHVDKTRSTKSKTEGLDIEIVGNYPWSSQENFQLPTKP
jgi:hypothetical protein